MAFEGGKMSLAGNGDRSSATWQHMPAAILVKIFTAFSIMEIVRGVSHICQSWRAACRDLLVWETVDLNELGYHPSDRIPSGPYTFLDRQSGGSRLMNMLICISDLGGSKVRQLVFNYFIDVRDEHLVFAARRFPLLKRLALPYCRDVTVQGFRAALQNWSGLESLIVEHIQNPCEILQLIGAHCKNFSTLKILFPFDLEFATSLYINVPGLKVLSIKNTYVDKDALNYYLTLKEDLESLSISHTQVISVRQDDGFVDISAEHVKASMVKDFYWCERQACDICFFNMGRNTVLRGEQDMELWREDDIMSLAF